MGSLWRAAGAAGAVVMSAVVGYAAPASRPDLIRPGEAQVTLPLSAPGAGVAGSVSLDEATRRILHCGSGRVGVREGCALAVYFWSPLMPLSRLGVAEVSRAAGSIGVELLVVDGSELESRAAVRFARDDGRPSGSAPSAAQDGVAAEMVVAGATVHYPALLVYRSGRPAGAAILGYKIAAAYRTFIEQRLADAIPAPSRSVTPSAFPTFVADTLALSVEFPVSGRPGAYFRSVPGRQALAYEAGNVVRLLHLPDGSVSVGPGHIDFVPTPDGRLFVTPAPNAGGLEFYDAAEVFAAAGRGNGREVEPIHADPALRDQYPSVGILESETDGSGSRTLYRILTSWFDRIAFRDYEVRTEGASGPSRIRPLGPRRFACSPVSLPILAPNGRELAGRDEVSATTKIFRIGEDGECREVADTGLPTGKVAWSPDGGRVAFAVPHGAIRDGRGRRGIGDPDLAGIFVFDRRSRDLRHVPGSEDASRLAFPEFVGADSLVYLLSPQEPGRRSVFRLVCCMR